MTLKRLAIPGITGTALTLLTGCPSPNTYTTPRTTPKGDLSHTVAIEAYSARGRIKETKSQNGQLSTVERDTSVTVPTFPTYQIRYGATDNLDLGASIRNLSSLGFDVKYNPVRGKTFDLAVDPGLQYFSLSVSGSEGQSSSVRVLYLHAPLLLGLNASESFSVVFSPGFTYLLASGSASTSGSDSLTTSTRPMARLGVGFNIRFSKGFALQPEATALRGFDDSKATLLLFGLGFNFGSLPSFE